MPLQQAFIVQGPWNEETRQHPAMRYMEALTHFMDHTDHSAWSDFYAEDFDGITPDGHHMDIGMWSEAAAAFYTDKFSRFKHVPYTTIATESKNGYDGYVLANLYADIKGEAIEHKKVTDDQHKEWDVRIPIFYRLDIGLYKDAPHDGLKVRHLQFFKDTKMVDDLVRRRGVEIPKRSFPKIYKHHEHLDKVK